MWSSCLVTLLLVICGFFRPGILPLALPVLVLANVTRVSAGDKPMSFNSKRVICECGARIVETGRKAGITLYTRNGVVLDAVHHEKRCKSCNRGYFYSFYSHGKFLHYDDACLEHPYLITSRKTCFAVDLLYEWSLSILHHNSRFLEIVLGISIINLKFSFTSLAEAYIDFHLGNVEDLEVSKETRECYCMCVNS